MNQLYTRALLTIVTLGFAGCNILPSEDPTQDQDDQVDITAQTINTEECLVTLYDWDNFDQDDDIITVSWPGEFTTLDNLPNSEWKNRTNEADSLKIGKGAKVTIRDARDFEGKQTSYKPWEEIADLDQDIYSMKIECV